MNLHFKKSEFQTREKSVLLSLQNKKLDALLLFRQESMFWLTGYDTFGYVFFQCMILTKSGRKILLTRSPDLRQAKLTSNIKDIRIWIDKEGSNPILNLKNILTELKLNNKNIGIEYESYGLTGRNTIMLNNCLKNFANLIDESFLISKLRLIKSKSEMVYIKKAAKLADLALKKAWELARPGMNEAKILSEMQGIILAEGGDYPGNEFIIGSGNKALLCRYFSGRRKLSKIDQLTLEFAGVYRHYHAALMRTIPIGKTNYNHIEMHKICLEALKACENKLKEGNSAGDVFYEYKKIIDKTKYKNARLNACGYSMGTTFAPNWMDWPMLYEKNSIILKENQIFFLHMILMHSESNTAMNLGETYIVKKNKCKRLGKLTLDLIVC